jgi:hypothetical protein
MRYRLRTLIILMAVLPPMAATAVWVWRQNLAAYYADAVGRIEMAGELWSVMRETTGSHFGK